MYRAVDTIFEPTLTDLLDEPIVRLVMASDGVEPGDVRALMNRIAARRRAGKVAAGGVAAAPRPDGAARPARAFDGAMRSLEACCGA
ncbi:hypothetical protein [Chthonobacter rhizosphaerae]|uniref:hypothetical protein n=1 Tax=Chthonobacter rhizosphaerae TaxID=2735553 RepID=UPI0015EEEF97|nr:hypothetical protein [Chthonobacter rhizosphaerae]